MTGGPRLRRLFAAAALGCSLAAACGVDVDSAPRPVRTEPSTTTTSSLPERGRAEVVLYYVREGTLLPVIDELQSRGLEPTLRALLQLRAMGLREPLPFGPRSGWCYYQEPTERGLAKARSQWRGSDRSWAEGAQAGYALALRGRDPFESEAGVTGFTRIAATVFGAVAAGVPIAPELDPEVVARVLRLGDDAE